MRHSPLDGLRAALGDLNEGLAALLAGGDRPALVEALLAGEDAPRAQGRAPRRPRRSHPGPRRRSRRPAPPFLVRVK